MSNKIFLFCEMEISIQNYQIKKFNIHFNEVAETIKIIHNTKKEMTEKLENIKQKIRLIGSNKNPVYLINRPSIFVIDKTVSLLDSTLKKMSATDDILGLINEIGREFDRSSSLLNLEILETDFDIPEDISHIQNLHDIIVQDLEALKKNIDSHLALIEKTELIMNILNYKLYEAQYSFRIKFDKLKEKKDSLLKLVKPGQEDPNVAIQVVQIDDDLLNLEENQQKELECVREQKIDAQRTYERACLTLDQNFQKMSNGYNKLLVLIEAEKTYLSDSQSKLVDIKFSEEVEKFKADIEKFTELQTTGWKTLYPDEKISEQLQQRGLKILHSGKIITEDGHTLTFQQAKDSKLLDDLSPQALEELRAHVVNNEDIRSESSKSDHSSVSNKMSTEDMHYLKQCLGKPLTLALAEITSLQPRDPIHYLGHWLFKYRYNQQMEDVNSVEFEILNEMRTTIAKDKWHKFVEDEARAAVIDMIVRAEETAITNELNRIQMEAEAMEETENYDDEARDTLGLYNGPQTGQMPLN